MSTSRVGFCRSAIFMPIMVCLPQLVQAANGEWFSLGHLGEAYTRAYAISANGTVVVGESFGGNSLHAFRWTSGGIQDLGTLGGGYSEAVAISADGSAVVGISGTGSSTHAFRWSSSGMEDLGTLGGNLSYAYGVSADGAAVVGSSSTGSNVTHAFRWTSAGMQDLGTLGGPQSEAYAISADGNAVAGSSYIDGVFYHAFRWTSAGMQDLGTLGGAISSANAISADGFAVVGSSYTSGNNAEHAFRWTGAGMQDLGTLGGDFSEAIAVSADGLAVAGNSYTAGGAVHAFRWTNAGMQDLGTLGGGGSSASAIAANGAVVVGRDSLLQKAFVWDTVHGMQSVADWTGVTDPYYSSAATAVSADGQTVVGYGDGDGGTEAWLARKGGLINPNEWLQSLNASQQLFQSGEYLSSLALDGSHHRPLALYANTTTSNSCVWANGDVGNYGYGRDATVGLAEVGVCGFSGGLTFGGSVGNAWQNQDFDYDGNLDVNGQFFTGEVNWQVPNTQVLLSTLAMYGSYEADVKRGYVNGAGEATSKGNTDMDTSTLRLRADWLDAFSAAEISFSPWTSVTATKTNVDSYTETTGPFPASFDSQDETATEARLGLTGRYALTATTTLLGTVETVHSMDDQGPNLTGEAVGLFSFDQSGQNTESNWQRVGVEVDQLVGKSGLVSVSLYGANEGQDANGSLAVKYIHSF